MLVLEFLEPEMVEFEVTIRVYDDSIGLIKTGREHGDPVRHGPHRQDLTRTTLGRAQETVRQR